MMILHNEFQVAAPVDEVWRILLDLERVVPCMPGATLSGIDGDEISGGLKMRVGPIGTAFEGTATFVEKDESAHRAVIVASGKDTKAQSNANATVTVQLEPLGPGKTRALLDTELAISGRLAQFGRGALADVSARLLAQFAENLHATVASPAPTEAPSSGGAGPKAAVAPATDATSVDSPDAGLDVLAILGSMLRDRAGTPLGAGVAGLVVGFMLGRLRRREPAPLWPQHYQLPPDPRHWPTSNRES